MIELYHIKITGFEEAIRGMRNSWESWDDSDFTGSEIGQKNLDLMKRLEKSGSDHAKYLRMIKVSMDIRAPLYWWKEFDTYKIGVDANSCSTMHTIHRKEFTREDFSCDKLLEPMWKGAEYEPIAVLDTVINELNFYRYVYLNGVKDQKTGKFLVEPKDKKVWYQMIQLLPSSYNQLRTISTNYEVLRRIYYSRKDHKLDEWREFCQTMKILPAASLITMEDEEDECINLNPTGVTRLIIIN